MLAAACLFGYILAILQRWVGAMLSHNNVSSRTINMYENDLQELNISCEISTFITYLTNALLYMFCYKI